MKINDKVITAFLLSMGLFSSLQAKTYVGSLSVEQKETLMAAAAATDKSVSGTDTVRDPVETNNNK